MESKQKRVCKTPYKKWTDVDVDKLLTFLRSNRPLEKPTAQAYYRRFLEQSGINSEWKHVRCKVKSMRQSYNAAKALQNSTGAGAMIEGETMQSVLIKKCPKYEEYEDVFGYREDAFLLTILDSENGEVCLTNEQQAQNSAMEFHTEQILTADPDFTDESFLYNTAHTVESETTCEDVGPQSSSAISNTGKKNSRGGQKGIYSRTGLADVLQVQSEILANRKTNKEAELKLKEAELEIQKEKILCDKENKVRELDLQKEKFLFEKEKHDIEMRRMDKQLRMERKLRIMEINMKKEIALREIAMKERLEIEKLKHEIK